MSSILGIVVAKMVPKKYCKFDRERNMPKRVFNTIAIILALSFWWSDHVSIAFASYVRLSTSYEIQNRVGEVLRLDNTSERLLSNEIESPVINASCDPQVYYGVQHCTDGTGTHYIIVNLNDSHVHLQTVLSLGPNGECNSVNHNEKDPGSNCPKPYPFEKMSSMLYRYKSQGAVAVINTDYFGTDGDHGAQGLAIRNGSRLDGPAHGVYNDLSYTQPSLAISPSNSVIIGIPGSQSEIDSNLSGKYYNTAAGAPIIVSGGQPINTNCTYPYPGDTCSRVAQSAAGITSDGRLILLTAQRNAASMASYFINNFGVHTAIKFDGGGSARLAWLDENGNVQSWGATTEDRPVAEGLLVFSSLIGGPDPTGNWNAKYAEGDSCWWDTNCGQFNGGAVPKCEENITGPQLIKDWGSSAPCGGMSGDNWVGNFVSTINFPNGNYVFHIDHDDGGKFWLNGENKGEFGGSGNNTICNGNGGFSLNGDQALRAMLREEGGDAKIHLTWDTDTSPCISPTAPSNLVANAVSQTRIDLSWQDNSWDETNFRVERSPDGANNWAEIATVPSNSTIYSNTGLTPNTRYYYRVKAYRSSGDRYSDFSNISDAITVSPLSAPSNLGATPESQSQIHLNWQDNSNDETNFRIERSPDGTTSWEEIATTAANAISYNNSGLTAETTYYYRVRAYRSSDNNFSPYSNIANATTYAGDTEPPVVNWSQPVQNEQTYYIDEPNGWVQLEATATDNVQVDTVRFYRWDAVNELIVEIGSDAIAPYQASVNIQLLNYYWNEVLVEAMDTSGNISAWQYIWLYRLYPAPCPDCGLANSTWPIYRHDLQRTGRSSLNGPTQPIVKWEYTVGGFDSSAPAMGADGTIYVGLGTYLFALSPTGSSIWSFPTGGVVRAPLVAEDGTIYVGSTDGKLYAINPNGTQKWAYATGGWIGDSPALASDGTIYIGSSDTFFYAINPDGTLQWKHEVGSWINSSPALDGGGVIYFGSTTSWIYALNYDGTQRWSYPTGTYVDGSPAIGSDGTIYIGSIDYNFYALSPNGDLIWSYTTGGAIVSSPAIGDDGSIYVGSEDNKLYAFDPSGNVNWSYTTQAAVNSSPSIGGDGTIYFGSDDGWIYALSPDGNLIWKIEIYGNTHGPVIGPDGVIYANHYGTLYAIGQLESVPSPTNLTATAVSSSQIDLNWSDNSSDETNFSVERSLDGTSEWTEIGAVNADTTTFSNIDLPAGTEYYYRVRAYRSSDDTYSDYSNIAAATTQAVPLIAPSALNALASSCTQIDLSWTDNSTDETNFRVERSADGTSNWAEIDTVNADTVIYSDTNLATGATYYYKVRAYRSSDGAFSDYSNIAYATTQACAVSLAINPSIISVGVGQNFDLVLEVQAGTQLVDGAAAYLNFDSTYLQVVSITPGNSLPLELEKNYDNTTGQVNYAAGTLSGPTSGSFTLATVTFYAQAQTPNTPIQFNAILPRKSDITYGGYSILSGTQDGAVTITPDVSIQGSVTLQGRPTPPDASWSVPLRVKLTLPGETTPIYSLTTTTDTSGHFVLGGILPGTYDVYVKNIHTLQNKQTIALVEGTNVVNFGTLKEGDANDNNFVNLTDFSILANTFSKCVGYIGYDGRADFNESGCVTLPDFSLLSTNFLQGGQILSLNPESNITAPETPQAAVLIVVQPALLNVNVGDTFSVTIQIQSGSQLMNGAQASMDFDSDQLRVNKLTGNSTNWPVEIFSQFDNADGTIDYAAGAFSNFPHGNVNLVVIQFEAIADTQLTPLTFHYGDPRNTDVTYGAGISVLTGDVDGQMQVGFFNKTAPVNGAGGVSIAPTLSWTTSLGVTRYEYCLSTTTDCSVWNDNGTATSVALSGLIYSTPYYWHVRAVNGVGTAYSDGLSTAVWSFTTQAPTDVRLANLNALSLPHGIQLKWQTAQENDLIGFNIYRSESPDGERVQINYELIAAITPGELQGNDYVFLDTTAEVGKTYYYWVEWVGNRDSELFGPVTESLAPNHVWLPIGLK